MTAEQVIRRVNEFVRIERNSGRNEIKWYGNSQGSIIHFEIHSPLDSLILTKLQTKMYLDSNECLLVLESFKL